METEDGVIASAPVVPARSLEDFERAIVERMDELADLVPDDGEPESEESRARREVLELQLHDLLAREGQKVDSVATVLRRFEEVAESCDEESKRLKKRAKVFENKRSRLCGYVLDVMTRWGVKKLDGEHSSLTRIQNAPTVEVEDVKALPFKFQRWAFTFIPKNEDELNYLQHLLERMEGEGAASADKKPLLDHVKHIEKRVALALSDGEVLGENEVIPDGVTLKPGAWRLSVR